MLCTAHVKGLEAPATGPERSACIPTGIAIPEPLARASRLLPVADAQLAIRASAHVVDIQASNSAVCVYALSTSLRDGDIVVNVAGAVGAVPRLEMKGGTADAHRRLGSSIAGSLLDAVAAGLSTGQPHGLEVPAVRPESTASTPASVAVAVPVASAVGVLPVANSDLAVRAASNRWNLETTDAAVRVDTDTIAWLNINVVVYTACTVGIVMGLDAKGHTVRIRAVVEAGE